MVLQSCTTFEGLSLPARSFIGVAKCCSASSNFRTRNAQDQLYENGLSRSRGRNFALRHTCGLDRPLSWPSSSDWSLSSSSASSSCSIGTVRRENKFREGEGSCILWNVNQRRKGRAFRLVMVQLGSKDWLWVSGLTSAHPCMSLHDIVRATNIRTLNCSKATVRLYRLASGAPTVRLTLVLAFSPDSARRFHPGPVIVKTSVPFLIVRKHQSDPFHHCGARLSGLRKLVASFLYTSVSENLILNRASSSGPNSTEEPFTAIDKHSSDISIPIDVEKSLHDSEISSSFQDVQRGPHASGDSHEIGVLSHGKAGFVSFYGIRPLDSEQREAFNAGNNFWPSLLWLLGPLTLVTSVVLPPLYLRKIFGALFDDSLLTDFLILLFTESLFFAGASMFLFIAHRFRSQVRATHYSNESHDPIYPRGYKLTAIIVLAAQLLLPIASLTVVWSWTGPAAAAALAPYMIGLLVQLGFEQIVRMKSSPVWPLVPVTFQVYRLHQLNRAAQLVAGLIFSLKGVEATAETMAINGSLQSLLFVLQVLGMLCLWSLGSFLTHQLPSQVAIYSTPSLP